MRGLRVLISMLACAALVIAPAGAEAKKAPKKKSTKVLKEAKATKPSRVVRFVSSGAGADQSGLGTSVNVSATTQIAVMNTALSAAADYFASRTSGCGTVTPILTSQSGDVLAGNFRDSFGDCYVWLNLQQSRALNGSEICKVTLHEYGHLTGLEHSSDPADLMFAPFQSDPIPAPCQARPE